MLRLRSLACSEGLSHWQPPVHDDGKGGGLIGPQLSRAQACALLLLCGKRKQVTMLTLPSLETPMIPHLASIEHDLTAWRMGGRGHGLQSDHGHHSSALVQL